jgi:DNA-binding NarL/FixJ family response regulator
MDHLDARSNQGTGVPDQQENIVVTFVDIMNRIMPAIEFVALNGSNPVLAAQLAKDLPRAKLPERPQYRTTVHCLSEREFQVLHLVSIGLSNQDVGYQLCISEGTVKKHLSSLLDKLDAGNRTHAVARARTLGIL